MIKPIILLLLPSFIVVIVLLILSILSTYKVYYKIAKEIELSIEENLVKSGGGCYPIWLVMDNNPRFIFPCEGEK